MNSIGKEHTLRDFQPHILMLDGDDESWADEENERKERKPKDFVGEFQIT